MTQAAVAERLGITSVKAHRLISRALAEGVVKITIEGDIVECVELENELRTRFALDFCMVAPDLDEEGQPFRALGTAGANYLRRQIEGGAHQVIGLGHGSTLAAVVQQMARMNVADVRFVSLLGGVTPDYSVNPHDVMHTIAEKTGARAHFLPVPFFANSVEDREVLLAQRGVHDILDLANKSTLKIVGIGTVGSSATLAISRMVEPREIKAIQADGGIGEMLGYFFDKHGRVLQTALTARTLSVSFGAHGSDQIVAIAGGKEKQDAIHAVLQSRRLRGLITDEATAKALLAR
ncbi:sugar-binding transcriptional regulator [Aestuariivirga litoralis]|uniref:sugar-binding transcriptional regulator n=1 Tax=Aestuariivirga litoralis TaxID=2650924 RepID=UPI0018C7ECC5|nr:sugar-binding transcriptional regulator [Aestuariivirga litoralis]